MKKLSIDDIDICKTSDDSTTLLHKGYNAHYRSIHGAVSESDWVFINGSNILNQKVWNVAELGFGLGTNFSRLIAHSWKNKTPIEYVAFDHQPLPPEVIPLRDNPSDMEILTHDLITSLLRETRNTEQSITMVKEHITITLHPFDLLDIAIEHIPNPHSALAFFHDPFGPAANPEAWTMPCFQRVAQILAPNGVMSTYGAAGHARRAMVAAGLYIASSPGFGRKREITFAAHHPDFLKHATVITKYQPQQSSNDSE